MVRSSLAEAPALPVQVADIPTPIGVMRLAYEGRRVFYMDLKERRMPRYLPPEGQVRVVKPPFARGSPPDQVAAYFRGDRKDFDVELSFVDGSAFDRKVWLALYQIPFGGFRTYGGLARQLGQPKAARAIGGATGRNPLPVIIPCHRMVGHDMSLTGFGLGLWRKRWLLKHEGIYPLPRARPVLPPGVHQSTLEESLRRPAPGRGRSRPS